MQKHKVTASEAVKNALVHWFLNSKASAIASKPQDHTVAVFFYHVTVCNAMHGTAKVFLSVKRMNCDKTKATCAQILIPHES